MVRLSSPPEGPILAVRDLRLRPEPRSPVPHAICARFQERDSLGCMGRRLSAVSSGRDIPGICLHCAEEDEAWEMMTAACSVSELGNEKDAFVWFTHSASVELN